LYREFYCVSTSTTADSYTLISPTSLSAATYVAGSGNTQSSILIESSIPLTQESTGIYYADLNPQKYASDVTYDLVYYVQYTPEAPPSKKLVTRFRIKTFNIANQLDFEISDSQTIDYEISDSTVIEYEILGKY